jgi:hypothetical protein
MRAVLAILGSFLLASTVVFAAEPAHSLNAKWSQMDLKGFEDFFFELGEDGRLKSRELGQLPEERLGALRKLSLDTQLRDFLEEKQDGRWRMALARLFALDSLLKAGFAGGLFLWDLRIRRMSSAESTPSAGNSSGPVKTKLGQVAVEDGCKEQIANVALTASGRPSSNEGKRRSSLAASVLRLGLAGSVGAWLSLDLYHAAQYQGTDLSVEWMRDQSQEIDMKKNLGEQLSSLQTSSLFEDLKAHLKQKGLNDVYLARVIAPFSESDLWSGSAKKAFVVIDHEADKTVPTITVELSWNTERGSWIYSDSWFGNLEHKLPGKPF